MKKFALVAVLALFAVAAASAAEIPPAAPTVTLDQIFGGASAPQPKIVKPLVPRCYTLDGTSCPSAGATTPCTDVCHNNLSCTCYNVYQPPYYIIVIGHIWSCNAEC